MKRFKAQMVVRLQPELKAAAEKKAKADGLLLADKVRALLAAYVDDGTDEPQPGGGGAAGHKTNYGGECDDTN